MKALITGAAGFIGSHLCERALERGWSVVGIDNCITGTPENLRGFRSNENFSFIEADVSSAFPEVEGIDAVLHFASPASPKDYVEHPLETLAVNSRGTENACRFAERSRARLLFASTSEIYGDPLEHPQREPYWGNVNSVGERSCYDEGKRYGEAVVSAFRRARGLDARIVRIFNTYGPRMRANDGRVVPAFVGQALRNEPLTIYGDGAQTRSLCYIDDLVEGILRFIESESLRYSVMNLGNDHEVTVREIAETVARLCDVPLRVTMQPLPPDDPSRRCPDISRAREALGWTPQIPLDEGLRRTISWFRTGAQSAAPLQA